MERKKVHLNEKLIATLPVVLRETNAVFIKQTGIKPSTWYRIHGDPNRITVQQLLAISNGMSVPVSRFFSPEGFDFIGRREDYVVPVNFQKCYYDSDAVRNLIGFGNAIPLKDAGNALDMCYYSASLGLLSVSRLPVERLLEFCDKFHINVFEYLIDPNPKNPVLLGKKFNTDESGLFVLIRQLQEDYEARFSGMHSEMNGMKAKIKEMEQRQKDLFAKLEALEKNQPASHIGVKIDNVGSNYIAMAAEPDGSDKG